jgi:hypothetical protein
LFRSETCNTAVKLDHAVFIDNDCWPARSAQGCGQVLLAIPIMLRRPYQFLHHWNLRIPGSHDHASLTVLLDRRAEIIRTPFAPPQPLELFARTIDPDLSTFHTKTFQRLGQCIRTALVAK